MPTCVNGVVFNTSYTESMTLVEPTHVNVATIASPRCGFCGSNPLAKRRPLSFNVPLLPPRMSFALPLPGHQLTRPLGAGAQKSPTATLVMSKGVDVAGIKPGADAKSV